MNGKPRLGISRCLLGEPVRYDGQHKHDHYLTDTLGPHVEYVGVCPEVECGMTIPREAVRMVGDPAAPRLLTQKTGVDWTQRMKSWAGKRLDELEKEDLCGFIFKARSPSSGLLAKVYNEDGQMAGKAPGMFARAFMERFPLLPVEDEGRLQDSGLRENFIERVFTLWRFRVAMRPRPTVKALMEFHARHKLLLMAHNEKICRPMGRLLAGKVSGSVAPLAAEYEKMLVQAMQSLATVSRHVNVLQHIQGYFRPHLSADEKQEMLEVISLYQAGETPLIVPVTLMRHYVRKFNVEYLQGQFYLEPNPHELKLRNHA